MSNEITQIEHSDSPPQLPATQRPARGIPLAPTRLSRRKARAIELFQEGKRVMDVAKEVGVNRGTIFRWQTTDPNFIAEMNRWRAQVLAETRDRIIEIGAKAATVLEKSIADGEARISIRIVEKIGCMNPGPQSPVDPFKVFGLSLEDEATRGPIVETVGKVSDLMSRQQALRMPQLLALAVAIDNHRAGDHSAKFILELAGPLAEEIMRSMQRPPTASFEIDSINPVGTDAATAAGTSSADASPRRKSAAQSPIWVVARVMSRSDKGDSSFTPRHRPVASIRR